MDRHRGDQAIGEGGDQGFPIAWPAQGGHQAPALVGRIQRAAVGQQMPPTHRCQGRARGGTQQGHPFRSGEVHQPQTHLRGGGSQGEQALQRQRLAQHRIEWPAGPQRLHPLSHKATDRQGRIAGRHQHRRRTHLGQAQTPLQQRQGRQALAAGEPHGPRLQLIAVGGQFLVDAVSAEAAPELQAQRLGPVEIEALRPIAPSPGPGQEGHGAVAAGGGRRRQGGEGLGTALAGLLQHAVGIHQGRTQPAASAVHLLDGAGGGGSLCRG